MKKQILILAMFTLAIFASSTKAFAQTGPVHVSEPRELNCADTLPLHPRAGMEYTYEVSNPSGDPVITYTWWTTKNPNFIDLANSNLSADTTYMLNVLPGELLSTGTPYGYGTGADSAMTITWTPEILAATEYHADTLNWQTASSAAPTPTFVAVLGTGDCTNNLEVWEIDPAPSFTVDIMNINPDDNTSVGYDSTVYQCTDEVQSAFYNPASDSLVMDYGADTLYFEVIAANYVKNWTPNFVVESGIVENQTADIGWYPSFADAQAGTSPLDAVVTGLTNADLGDTLATANYLSQDVSVTDVSQGVSIFVKVVIHNNDYELDGEDAGAGADFVLTVDARDNDDAGEWDLSNNDPTNDVCTSIGAPDGLDQAKHTITPRPTLQQNGGVMNEPSGTDPDNFIGKTNDINTP